jgi:hypothetical protein
MKQIRPTFLLIRTAAISEFRARNLQLITLGEQLLWLEWQLCSLVAHLDNNFSPIVVTCMQQLHDYHRESLLLCMRQRGNIALALTRMACELARGYSVGPRLQRRQVVEVFRVGRLDLGQESGRKLVRHIQPFRALQRVFQNIILGRIERFQHSRR